MNRHQTKVCKKSETNKWANNNNKKKNLFLPLWSPQSALEIKSKSWEELILEHCEPAVSYSWIISLYTQQMKNICYCLGKVILQKFACQ